MFYNFRRLRTQSLVLVRLPFGLQKILVSSLYLHMAVCARRGVVLVSLYKDRDHIPPSWS